MLPHLWFCTCYPTNFKENENLVTMMKNAAGLVVFVDVRSSDGSNRSAVIRDKLALLGATVTLKLTKEVTHVVFRDGLKVNYV